MNIKIQMFKGNKVWQAETYLEFKQSQGIIECRQEWFILMEMKASICVIVKNNW